MEEKSSKDIIIEILAEDWPLSAKVIYNRVKQTYKRSISYQATYKMINEMLEKGILSKYDLKYSLDINWIKRSKDFYDNIEKNYFSKGKRSKIPYSKAHLHNYVQYYFTTIMEVGDFLANYFVNFPNPENAAAIARWNVSMYSLIGISRETISNFRKFTKDNLVYIICRTNSLYDKMTLGGYKIFTRNVKVKLGIDFKNDCDYIIVGNYVGRLYFSPIFVKRVENFVKYKKNMASLNLHGMINIMQSEYNPPNCLIIEYNPNLAKQLREDSLSYFK